MCKLLRKGNGQPIRDAMRAHGWSYAQLAAETRRIDPAGKGISPAIVGRLAGQGETARERCQIATAYLMSKALAAPLQDLFDMPAPATATVERTSPSEHRRSDRDHRNTAEGTPAAAGRPHPAP